MRSLVKLMTIVGGVAASVLAGTADASPTREQVALWFSAEREQARQKSTFEHHGISWRTEDLLYQTPEEISAMRARVEGRPEHPDRSELDSIERMIRNGPFVMKFRLFARNDSAWRHMNDQDGWFSDTIVSPGIAWSSNPRTLALYPADPGRRSAETGGHDPANTRKAFVFELSKFFHGRVDEDTLAGFTVAAPEVAGRQWVVQCVIDEPSAQRRRKMVYSGEWDESLQRGFVRSWVTSLEQQGVPDIILGSETYDEWALDSVLDRWRATKVLLMKPDGRVWRRNVYEGPLELPEGGWKSVFEPPLHGDVVTDVFRGEIKPNKIFDFRTHKGESISANGERVAFNIVPKGPSDSNTKWRIIGWVLLGSFAGAVVILVVRRRKA